MRIEFITSGLTLSLQLILTCIHEPYGQDRSSPDFATYLDVFTLVLRNTPQGFNLVPVIEGE